jgi:pimeloyl-ACP methyl ester carboxylesterase
VSELSSIELFPPTDDGWCLHLVRTSTSALDPRRRPVMIVPGYGMNGFIFGFHPAGTSFVRHLAEAGLEVWVANLRCQGKSKRTSPEAPGPSLRRYAETDLRTAITAALKHTETRADRVDLIGASLGGSISYAHLALEPEARVGSIVAVGSPLRWESVPPLLRIPFRSPRIAGLVRVSGTQKLVSKLVPVATRVPALLSLYLTAANVDLSAAAEMIRTVEDPDPRVNADIARWLAASDMVLRGVNVTHALRAQQKPLFLVVGNRDGIVPEASALSARAAWGGSDVEVLVVGDQQRWYAHADLFVGREAPGGSRARGAVVMMTLTRAPFPAIS